MITIADHIRQHLAATGKSMRALSLEASMGAKAVADILSGKSKRPFPASLDRLSQIVGVDLASVPIERQITAADMRRVLQERPPQGWSTSQIKGAISALNYYVRASGASGHEATIIDRKSVRAWLSATTAVAQGLEASTYSTYASHLRAVLDLAAATTRTRRIDDVTGPWRDLYDRCDIVDVDLELRVSRPSNVADARADREVERLTQTADMIRVEERIP